MKNVVNFFGFLLMVVTLHFLLDHSASFLRKGEIAYVALTGGGDGSTCSTEDDADDNDDADL